MSWRQTILLVAIFVPLVGSLMAWRVWFPGRAFDGAEWAADLRGGTGTRQAMADRLLAQRTLIGLTRAEAVNLLGEPPPTGYSSDWDLVYWLG